MNYQLLVNDKHPIAKTDMEKITLIPVIERNQIFYLEKKVAKQYLKLKRKVLRKTGVIIALDSAYRSIEEQQCLMEDMIQEYGVDYASNYVAKPYTSEHHTGMAIDLTIYYQGKYLTNNFELEKAYEEFCKIYPFLGHYGFVLRYPKGKESITNIPFEMWHIRYVGVKVAKKLKKRKHVLEQYKRKL